MRPRGWCLLVACAALAHATSLSEGWLAGVVLGLLFLAFGTWLGIEAIIHEWEEK